VVEVVVEEAAVEEAAVEVVAVVVEAVEAVAVEEEGHLVVHPLHKPLLHPLPLPITMAEDWWERNQLYSTDRGTRVKRSFKSSSCTPMSMRTTMRSSSHSKESS
jgi:hypothetical protein